MKLYYRMIIIVHIVKHKFKFILNLSEQKIHYNL